MTMALEIRELNKEYPGFRLENLNLKLPQGCIMGLIGENGAGKSTIIRLILGLAIADSGEILVNGERHTPTAAAWKELVGVVHDECFFPAEINGKQLGLVLRRIYRTWDEQKFEEYLTRFQLPGKKPLRDYSRGMRMKLSIAAALSHDSRLLILDEATSGLDPIVRDEILTVFREYIQDEEKAILMSSHIVSDLEKICDYIAFLHRGRLVFCEEKDLLKEQYRMVRCGRGALSDLPEGAVAGTRENAYGVEALVRIDPERPPAMPPGSVWDPATIEDIMLYAVREEGK